MAVGSASSISIVLSDGDPDGIRTAEIGVSTIKVIAFRRNQLERACSEFGDYLPKCGVYLLYGQDEAENDVVYIGESEKVSSRLKFHKGNSKEPKDYWLDTVVIVSKDENLTKSHVRFIEAKLIAAVNQNVSWKLANNKLTNGNPPLAAKLPQAEIIKMREFIDQAKILTRMIGCDFFKATSGNLANAVADVAPIEASVSPEFRTSGLGYDAKAVVLGLSGDWVVKAMSRARITEANCLSNGVRKIREQLKAAGKLVESEGALIFQEDCLFKSPSTAANVVCGTMVNGRNAWKLENGIPYSQWESEQAGPLPDSNYEIE